MKRKQLIIWHAGQIKLTAARRKVIQLTNPMVGLSVVGEVVDNVNKYHL